jgi:TRAP-type C4-dicarboxylate transport system permease large subunit
MVLCLIAGSVVFGHFLSLSTLSTTIVAWARDLDVPSVVVIAIICIFYIIGGCFMDALGLLVLTIPITAPVVFALGYDPIWYAVIMCMLGETGAITPPFGVNVFVLKGIAKDVPLNTIFKGIWPFFVTICLAIGIVIAFPEIATFIPSLTPTIR